MTKVERLQKLEEAYTFVDNLENVTRNSITMEWPESIRHWELLTWCTVRKRQIDNEGSTLVRQINGNLFAYEQES